MRWLWLVAVVAMAACSHQEQPGTTAGESVPRPQQVIENAIPRDLPPAAAPIPPTSRSAQQQVRDAGGRGLEVYGPGMGPRQVPRAPAPEPIGTAADGGVSPSR